MFILWDMEWDMEKSKYIGSNKDKSSPSIVHCSRDTNGLYFVFVKYQGIQYLYDIRPYIKWLEW